MSRSAEYYHRVSLRLQFLLPPRLSSSVGNRRPLLELAFLKHSKILYQTCVVVVDRLIAPTVVCKTLVNILIFWHRICGTIWKQKIACLVRTLRLAAPARPTPGPRVAVSPGPQGPAYTLGSLWQLAPERSWQQSVYLFSFLRRNTLEGPDGRNFYDQSSEWLSEQGLKSVFFFPPFKYYHCSTLAIPEKTAWLLRPGAGRPPRAWSEGGLRAEHSCRLQSPCAWGSGRHCFQGYIDTIAKIKCW